MKLKIIIPEKVLFEGDVKNIKFNTSKGEIEILSHHTPLFTDIKIGEMEYTTQSGQKDHIAASNGFAQIVNNSVSIVLDNAIFAHEINVEKAQEAKREAEKLIKDKSANINTAVLTSQLQLADLNLKMHKKYHVRIQDIPLSE
jgi:F-type H+-transporting ATPase subunit epsilon